MDNNPLGNALHELTIQAAQTTTGEENDSTNGCNQLGFGAHFGGYIDLWYGEDLVEMGRWTHDVGVPNLLNHFTRNGPFGNLGPWLVQWRAPSFAPTFPVCQKSTIVISRRPWFSNVSQRRRRIDSSRVVRREAW